LLLVELDLEPVSEVDFGLLSELELSLLLVAEPLDSVLVLFERFEGPE
jgi:hypothetical protein